MKVLLSFLAVCTLILLSYTGVEYGHLYRLFGVFIPYLAFLTFLGGFIYKIIYWAKSPVPFNITTTAGQQKSLSWIKPAKMENPSSSLGVAWRVFLEVLFFRSLFRNNKLGITSQNRPGFVSDKSLWLAGMVFHWSFFFIFIRHLRFFTQPVPSFLGAMESFDQMFQIGLPVLYLTDLFLILSVTFLFIRRVMIPQVRYISLLADYFPLFVLLAIGLSGICMRYFTRIDVVGVKSFTLSLLSFSPEFPEKIGSLFFVHLFLVSILFMYFPFSKLMHMGGIFLSPTRNMTGDSRKKRHVNPWDYPVKVHTYEEYEDDFRDMMKGAGLPLEKEPPEESKKES